MFRPQLLHSLVDLPALFLLLPLLQSECAAWLRHLRPAFFNDRRERQLQLQLRQSG